MIIEDGKGNGYATGVNPDNQLLTHAVTLDAMDNAARKGDSYALTTDILTLTNGNIENGFFYILNTNPLKDLSLQRMWWSFGKASTAGDVIMRGYANPTGGTLLTAGVPLTFHQRNLGSRFVAQATAYRLNTMAQTVIGGTLIMTRVFQDQQVEDVVSGLMIPAGSALAFTIAAPTGSTSMRASLSVAIYFLER